MQKVEGSSPFIRSSKAPLDGAFCCSDWRRESPLSPRSRPLGLTAAPPPGDDPHSGGCGYCGPRSPSPGRYCGVSTRPLVSRLDRDAADTTMRWDGRRPSARFGDLSWRLEGAARSHGVVPSTLSVRLRPCPVTTLGTRPEVRGEASEYAGCSTPRSGRAQSGRTSPGTIRAGQDHSGLGVLPPRSAVPSSPAEARRMTRRRKSSAASWRSSKPRGSPSIAAKVGALPQPLSAKRRLASSRSESRRVSSCMIETQNLGELHPVVAD
jgi:hypothetical protein